jgi:starch-binding outer membrane protein, SusD/RagB family
MKKNIIILSAALLGLGACTGEYLNPGTASEQQVITSQTGLIAMVNGLQQKFTTSRAGTIYAAITADGLTTKQLKVLNAGNTDEVLLESGGTSLINSNGILNNLWNQAHLTKSNADIIIKNINNAPDPAIKSYSCLCSYL